jgi:hypothetical protein
MIKRYSLWIFSLILFSAIVTEAASYLYGDAVRSPDRTKTWTMPSVTGTLSCVACTESPTNKTFAIGSNTWTGQFSVANGGTGQTSLAAQSVLVGNGTSGITQIANQATPGYVFAAAGTGVDPGWTKNPILGYPGIVTGQLLFGGATSGVITIQPQDAAGTYNFNLPTGAGSSGQPLLSGGGGSSPMTFGTLGVAGGGTGATSLTANALLLGNGTSAFQVVTPQSTQGYALQTDGSGLPYFDTTLTLGKSSAATGQLDLAGSTSGIVSIKPQNAAGTYNLNLPTTAGSSGQVLASGGGGSSPMTWVSSLTNPMDDVGQLIVGGAAGAATKLAAGTQGYVLTANGAGAAPSYQAIPSSSLDMQNCGIATSVAAGALTISLKQADGSSDPTAAAPCKISFGSSTATSGAYNQRSVTAAISVTVPSGATLGCNSGTLCQVWVYAIDNAGTVELAVATQYTQSRINSSTTIGTGADDYSLYSTTGRANKPIRMIARMYYGTAPNGTYSAVPDGIYLGDPNNLRVFEYFAATSSTKSPTASGNYNDMTGNSVTLQPGSWLITGNGSFSNSGASPSYTQTGCGFYAADGADSSSQPTALSIDAGSTTLLFAYNGGSSAWVMPCGAVRLTVTTTTTVYLVTYQTATTIANSRVIGMIYAERIR